MLIYIITSIIKEKNIKKNEAYKYFQAGIFFKIGLGIAFGLIYVFYYGGGDTTAYYASSVPLARLFWESPSDYFELMIRNPFPEGYLQEWRVYSSNIFSAETGIPYSSFLSDPKTFMVCKLISPLLIITGESYFASTILLSTLMYYPIWKLFLIFDNQFKGITFKLAIAFLFIPSVAFWGSGIMKDTFTYSATLLFVVAVFSILKYHQKWKQVMILLFASFIIISIKPYIFIILLPSTGLWIYANSSNNISSPIIKFIALPFLFVVFMGGSLLLLNSLGASMDKFALDKAIETTVITQDDFLNNKSYGDNKFDIGELDGSVSNLLSKFPIATFSGLYRPSMIEVRNIVSLISAVENLFLMYLFSRFLFTVGMKKVYKIIKENSLLLFCLIFTLLFAFMIGVTTPNFGALVRFKIPLIPFYVALLFILNSKLKFSKNTL